MPDQLSQRYPHGALPTPLAALQSWRVELARAARNPRLHKLILSASQDRLRSRFITHYINLNALPRRRRRQAMRGWAPALGEAALLIALLAPNAESATIGVSAPATERGAGGESAETRAVTCTLRDAIVAANTDLPVGGCPAGSGADILELSGGGNYLYGTADNTVDGPNALPSITSDITILGHGALIGRLAGATEDFRLLHIATGAILVLEGSTVTGGAATFGAGGGLFNRGNLTIRRSVIIGNSAAQGGGGIYSIDGSLELANSTVLGNSAAYDGGGIYSSSGSLVVTHSTISGNSATDGGGVFLINAVSADITGSTLSGNTASQEGGGVYLYSNTLAIDDSTITGNTSTQEGAGIFTRGSVVEVTNSSISDNRTSDDGGALYVLSGAANLAFTTMSGNIASGGLADGGAIYNRGALSVSNCTIDGNSATIDGGGIFNISGTSTITITNSTISGNTASDDGGGVYVFTGTANLINTTVTANSATDDGGGLYTNGTFNIPNTIVAGNNASGSGPDIFGSVHADYSLIGSTSGATIIGANNQYGDPILGMLQDNGGPTLTHALLPGSPALDTGDNGSAAGLTDQRGSGFPRIFNATVDIGAFEASPSEADLAISKTDGVTSATPGGGLTYTIVAGNNGPRDVASASVTDTLPADLSCSYTSVSTGGALGNTAAGAGDLAETLALPSGSSVTYTLSCDIDPGATGALSNTAAISSAVADPISENNSATDNDTVLIPSADLSVAKSDGLTSAGPGQLLMYTILVSNAGPSTATSLSLGDSLPAGLSYQAAAGTGWMCEEVAGTVTCTMDSLAPLASAGITLSAVTADPWEGWITNTAAVQSAATDPISANDSSSDQTYVGFGDPVCSGWDLTLSGTFGPGEIVCHAINHIWTDPDGGLVIEPGAIVHFVSPEISLNTGFEVQDGGTFYAY